MNAIPGIIIRRGRVLTPDPIIENSAVVVEEGRIKAIEPEQQVAESPEGMTVVNAAGLFIAPGLIDLHVHGGSGSDTMDATPQDLHTMAEFFLSHGVTSYLPTTITQSPAAIRRAIDNVKNTAADQDGAQALGLHLEGPYLGYDHRGAQPAEWLRNPDEQEYRRWFETGAVRLITVAPELPGALEFIRQGSQQGLIFSVGHTAASYQQVEQAADAGLSHSTHTFNGMTGLHHRQPGAAGAVLTDERITAEIIADGVHLHSAVLRLVVKAKGIDRVLLVTDSMRAAGLPDGEYDLGGQAISVAGGVARTPSGGLAGSTLTMDRAVANMVKLAGLSLSQALVMATTTPAARLGLSGVKGAIRPGADADIILVDEGMNVHAVMVHGRMQTIRN